MAGALALAFLVFVITTASIIRVAGSYAQISLRHAQTSALFLADAGLQKAASRLAQDRSYAGETGTRLPTGRFDVTITRSGDGYVVTSTGYSDSQLAGGRKRTVRATVRVTGDSFRITDWRENP